MLLWIIVSGYLSALCNCWVSCPGPVSLFAQDFQIALGRKSSTPPVWPQQRRGESQPSCTDCFWAWPRLRALALLLEHSNGTTCLPMASGLEWIPDPYYFAAWSISGQLHPSPWALSGSDSHLHHSFCTQGKKTQQYTTIVAIMARAIKKGGRKMVWALSKLCMHNTKTSITLNGTECWFLPNSQIKLQRRHTLVFIAVFSLVPVYLLCSFICDLTFIFPKSSPSNRFLGA